MKQRSPVAVILLPFVTFGIYSIYWLVSTKIEMTKLGAKIPTAWLIFGGIGNIRRVSIASLTAKSQMSWPLYCYFYLGLLGKLSFRIASIMPQPQQSQMVAKILLALSLQ